MSNKSIAVIDSGVGGLSILKKLKDLLPFDDFVYYSDGANLPYGDKSQDELCGVACKIVEELRSKFDIDLFVLACNTLTAGAIDFLRDRYPQKDFVGCEPNLTQPKKEGKSLPLVVCTPFTADSPRIKERFLYKKNSVRFVATPSLAQLIEERASEDELREYLYRTLGQSCKECDCIVLGCTHYFFKQKLFEDLFELPVYTSVEGVAKRVLQLSSKKTGYGVSDFPVTCFIDSQNNPQISKILYFLNSF